MNTYTIRIWNFARSVTAAILLACAPPALIAQPVFLESTSTHLTVTMPENGMDVEAADLDKDGDLDIIIANEFQPNVILLNDGAGHFTNVSVERFPKPIVSRDSEDIAMADFDGDGDLDIIFVSEDDFTHEYYLNDGNAFFTSVSSRLPQSIANGVVAADVTGDGHVDLFIGNAGQDFALINDGTGVFVDETAKRLPEDENITQDIELADIDRDGDLDLVLGNEDGNKIYINGGNGFFVDETEARLPIEADMETRKVALGDVDRDGDLDIFYSNVGWKPGKDPQNRLYLNDGRGYFTDVTDALLPFDTETTIDGRFADIDRDGDLDILTANFQKRPIKVFRNDGTGQFSEATSSFFSPVPVVTALGIEFADFNGDSLIDLYLCNRGERDRFYIHTGAGIASAEEMMAPGEFAIDGNHPNPFTDATSIEYSLPRATPVEVAIFNTLGQRVATLLDTDQQSSGRHGVRWFAAGAPPGLYNCRIITANGIRTIKMILD